MPHLLPLPVTNDPRLSDLGSFASLVLYGPPRPGARAVLVLVEDGGVWSAYRSDLTPPSLVRTLVDLSEATSASRAVEMAVAAARRAARVRTGWWQMSECYGHKRWLRSMRSRFTSLTRRAVEAASALHARDGDGLVESSLV